mgnify:CR=1 FL=1
MQSESSRATVLVWDLPLRVFHWVLAAFLLVYGVYNLRAA